MEANIKVTGLMVRDRGMVYTLPIEEKIQAGN